MKKRIDKLLASITAQDYLMILKKLFQRIPKSKRKWNVQPMSFFIMWI
jgi:hypothetical protein